MPKACLILEEDMAFQLHSGYSLSLCAPSPSRLLRLGRLDSSWRAFGVPAALFDQPDVCGPPGLWDGCRLPGFVEKLLLERNHLLTQVTKESRMTFLGPHSFIDVKEGCSVLTAVADRPGAIGYL